MKDHISICVPTFHRNNLLERLIRRLKIQEKTDLFDISIVVVDNDELGHARETVTDLKEKLSLDITYEIEKKRNIAVVRNHALRLAKGNYIGFIDDDEFPSPLWLKYMYLAIKTFDVDGALGPVHPFFEQKPPKWLVKGRFCERPVYRTGTILGWRQTRTGNVLLKKEVFEKHKLKFDPQFKTGGSDQEFFKQSMARGCRFVAVEEAPVYEVVFSKRWAKSYYLKRALVNGFNSYRYISDQSTFFSKGLNFIKSFFAIFVYTLALPFCSFIGMHAVVKILEKGFHHFSRIMAMFDIELVKNRNF